MKHLDLFSGIGGFALAASWVWPDHEIASFCEIDPYCHKVLKKHWPDASIHTDIKTLKGDSFGSIDLVSGGFPCQPYSVAGKQRGSEDDRALWPEMLRVIKEAKPTWVLGENVAGIIHMELDQVLSDLETCGYETQAFVIPACAVNAPHRRDRVWIVAYSDAARQWGNKRQSKNEANDELLADPKGIGLQRLCVKEHSSGYIEAHGASYESSRASSDGSSRIAANSHGAGLEKLNSSTVSERQGFRAGLSSYAWANWPTQSPVCGRDDGISQRMDRLRALGNAIVPQVAAEIMKAIRETGIK